MSSFLKTMTIFKAFKYRIYPTGPQEILLNKTFGCVRKVWNRNVDIFNKYDRDLEVQEMSLTSTELKTEFPFMKEVSAAALQQKQIDFQSFKKNFFSKERKGKKIGRPFFKTKFGKQSYRLPNQKFGLNSDSIRLEKIPGPIKLIKDKDIPVGSKLMNVTISKNLCNQFFASVLVETEISPLPNTGKSVGIDLGLKEFLIRSDGETVKNPRLFRDSQAKLKIAQRNLARKRKGSVRRRKAKLKVARIHNKIANCRKDFLHKETTKLVKEFDFIGIEDLNVSGMVKNHKLAKSISDASWSEFVRMLTYKALWYGKEVVKIGRFFASSKTCNCCGWKNVYLTLQNRIFNCRECGSSIDRDLNAAKNILKEALRIGNAIRTQSGSQPTQPYRAVLLPAVKRLKLIGNLLP